MYISLIRVGYTLFTTCMTLAGMLTLDPEGALLFVSTLPLPFAPSIMTFAPALVSLQLKYVALPLERFEIFIPPSSKARPSHTQLAQLPKNYWCQFLSLYFQLLNINF
jgi:hypothetical protein